MMKKSKGLYSSFAYSCSEKGGGSKMHKILEDEDSYESKGYTTEGFFADGLDKTVTFDFKMALMKARQAKKMT